MQIFIHCKTILHVSGVTAPIIRSIKTVPGAAGTVLILLMMGAMIPETCTVVLQWINICILLHLLDFYSHNTLNYVAIRSHTSFSIRYSLRISTFDAVGDVDLLTTLLLSTASTINYINNSIITLDYIWNKALSTLTLWHLTTHRVAVPHR